VSLALLLAVLKDWLAAHPGGKFLFARPASWPAARSVVAPPGISGDERRHRSRD
jgi:hypothetical protein